MPSLQQLEEFTSSFTNIGSEANSLSAAQYSSENFPLPDSEPPAPFPDDIAGNPEAEQDPNDFDFSAFLNPSSSDIPEGPETEAAEFSAGLPGFDLPDDSGGADFPAGEAFPDLEKPDEAPADFSGLDGLGLPEMPAELSGEVSEISELPAEFPADEAAGYEEIPAEEFTGEAPSGEISSEEIPVGEIPPDLLSGFAGDLETNGLPADENLSFPAVNDSGENDNPLDFSTIDLSNAMDIGGETGPAGIADFDISAESFAGTEDAAEAEDTAETESLAAEDPAWNLPDDAFGSEEPPASAADEEQDTAFPDISGAGISDADISDAASLDISDTDISDISAPENEWAEETLPVLEAQEDISPEAGGETEISAFPDIGIPESENRDAGAGDPFDSFNPDGESWLPPEDASLETPDFNVPAEDASGFSLDGFDDFGGSETDAEFAAPQASGDVEEITLNEDEFRRLQESLSSYPLNLRMACEELIAEQAVAPDLMSAMIKLLVRGAPAKEAASLAGKILGRSIPIPKGFAKQTGAGLEEEQASFGYIFVKKFLPVLRIFLFAALAAVSLGYLSWRFIINPLIADGIYKDGYERIFAGDYGRANDLFRTAFERHRVKRWFYRYAEAFREVRNYERAAEKYDQLLRVYPRDKKGALDYADMESYRRNFRKADEILRHNILDYAVNDREALTALAENNLAWAEEEPSRYEEARAAYSRLIDRYGRQDSFLEGMLKYFIRTDKLGEVLPLQTYFMAPNKKRKISVPTLAELGGYLLDKRFEEARVLSPAEPRKVPDEYADRIDGIRDVLLRGIREDPAVPESYYHLGRYYNRYGSTNEERSALENAIRVFNAAEEGNPRRAGYRIDAYRRYAETLINAGEFFPAEEQLVRGIGLFEDARTRNILGPDPLFGRLYGCLGDLAFYSHDGNMEEALRHYREAEANGWTPVEIQYRMGVAHYELSQWEEALRRFFTISGDVPNNRRLLYALGNVSYLRGDYFAAQSYYNRLMDILDAERLRFPNLMPGSRPEEQELAERIMTADNNMGVTLETLTRITGNTGYRSRALGFFAESIRAWDVITRNPENMTRLRPLRDLYGPGINLAYLNVQNILNPSSGYDQQIFMRIDRDLPEPSVWETLVPRDYRLSENLYTRE
ncbi:MAG: tetratricopeptide repeat protein [Treponema sp.]|jgi:tetratricopeptide (TPR) repeat protein|nr:tetratricopeptide repeat protein [Treponema sp.]